LPPSDAWQQLFVLAITATTLLHSSGIAFSQVVSEADPDGRIGDLVGVWQCTDPVTQRSARVVEFRSDGTCEITNAQGSRDFTGRYEQQGESVFFRISIPANSTAADPRLQAQGIDLSLFEKGRILRWLDGDLFKYQVQSGQAAGPYGKYPAGTQLEFHRLTSTKSSIREGSLVGTWQEVDLTDQRVYRVIELKADGTYEVKNERNVFTEPTRFYQYHDGILSLFFRAIGYQERRMERGKVNWTDKNRFTLTLLDGDAVGSLRGKVYEFRRQ